MPDGAHGQMLYRSLGATGERVSAIGVGGFHLGLPEVDEALAIKIVRTAIDHGVTFLDNCWDYNDGASEIRMGKALRDGYRDKAFLMTKIDGRSRAEAARQLDESLRRLADRSDRPRAAPRGDPLRRPAPHLRATTAPTPRCSRRVRPASCATSASRATRTRASICTCSRSPPSTALPSTRCRCRSTSWTPTTAASRRSCSRA